MCFLLYDMPMTVLLSVLLGRTDDDIELTPSLENEESSSKGVAQDQVALSMAEIASCSYEARYSKVFIEVSPCSIKNTQFSTALL